MTTRISAAIDDNLFNYLREVAEIRQRSMSAIIEKALEEYLENQEDIYFSKLAEKREEEKTISHDEVWK